MSSSNTKQRRNGRGHLRLVANPQSDRSKTETAEVVIGENPFEDPDYDIAVVIDEWLESIREFNRLNVLSQSNGSNTSFGRFGPADYPLGVIIAVGDIVNFAADSYSERAITKPGSGLIFSEEVLFEGFSSLEMDEFLKGFKDALAILDLQSQRYAKHLARRNGSNASSRAFQAFKDLDSDLQTEIAYQFLSDSLEAWRSLRNVGYEVDPKTFALNNPAFYFEPGDISRAIDFGCKDQSAEPFTMGKSSTLPGMRNAQKIVSDPVNEVTRLLGEARQHVAELALQRAHPSADLTPSSPGRHLSIVR